MDPIILTPRLKLTLVTKAERGSPEFEWLHELRSNKEATWWSINGQSKSLEDTEKALKGQLSTTEAEQNSFRIVYAVHKLLGATGSSTEGECNPQEQGESPSQFIGNVSLRTMEGSFLPLSEDFSLPGAIDPTTLSFELGYAFLPTAWGKGYATESVNAVFEACRRARSLWESFSQLYIRAIVNAENPGSMRVVAKTGMTETGIYEWIGRIFLAGEVRERSGLHIYGIFLFS